MRTRITNEQRNEILGLLAQGISPRKIAADMGINYQTVYWYRKRVPKPMTAGQKAAQTRKLNKEQRMGKVTANPIPIVIHNGTGKITISFEPNMSSNVVLGKNNQVHILDAK